MSLSASELAYSAAKLVAKKVSNRFFYSVPENNIFPHLCSNHGSDD